MDATQKLVEGLTERATFSASDHGDDPWWRGHAQGLRDAVFEIERAAQRLPTTADEPVGNSEQFIQSEDYRESIEVFDVEDANGDITEAVYADQLDGWLAAQRPPVMDEIEFRLSLIKEARAERDEARAAIENARRALVSAVDGPSMTIDAKAAIQGVLEALAHVPAAPRPPVSPEAREALANVLWERFKAGHYAFHSEEMADAILDRFSVPSQPVYDEKKIAEVVSVALAPLLGQDPGGPTGTDRAVAAAIVAALRGGELTREET